MTKFVVGTLAVVVIAILVIAVSRSGTVARNALAVLRLMTSANLAGREPQGLPGVPPLAQGGNVFAVSVA